MTDNNVQYSIAFQFAITEKTDIYSSREVFKLQVTEVAPVDTEDPVAYLRSRLRKEFARKAEEFTTAANGGEESI